MRWIRAFGTALTVCLLAVSVARATSPFIVYFEPGGVRLDGRAQAILDNAASAILANETRQVEVPTLTVSDGDQPAANQANSQ